MDMKGPANAVDSRSRRIVSAELVGPGSTSDPPTDQPSTGWRRLVAVSPSPLFGVASSRDESPRRPRWSAFRINPGVPGRKRATRA